MLSGFSPVVMENAVEELLYAVSGTKVIALNFQWESRAYVILSCTATRDSPFLGLGRQGSVNSVHRLSIDACLVTLASSLSLTMTQTFLQRVDR